MGLLIISLSLIFGFGLLTFLRKWHDSFIIIAFAIGFVVNANLYTAFTGFNVEAGPFVFAIDSVLYTLFLYCICIKTFHYSLKDVKLVIYSSIVAIIISAFIEFFAGLSVQKDTIELAKRLAEYIFSALGSLIACWYMVMVIKKMEAKNISKFIILPCAIIGGALIDSTIYYCLSAAVRGGFDNGKGMEYFVKSLLGSWVGKIISCAVAELCYFINVKFWVPNEIKEMEKTK